MKINRLLEIVILLLTKKNVTASDLAKRFNVSTRTIYRDIDALAESGIPVYTTQGAKGGISIIENYTINTTTLSDNEKDSVLFALKSLQATKYPAIDLVLEKLSGVFKKNSSDWIIIDYSPWGSNPNANNKFNDIKKAILQSKTIQFEYINAQNGKTIRKVQPLRLIYKSNTWYIWGFCMLRKEFRTFRISRIKNVNITSETFDKNSIMAKNVNKNKNDDYSNVLTHFILQFEKEVAYRIYDDYDEDMVTQNADGTFTLEVDFVEDDWVYNYILSFGDSIKVIEPFHVQQIILKKCENIIKKYKSS